MKKFRLALALARHCLRWYYRKAICAIRGHRGTEVRRQGAVVACSYCDTWLDLDLTIDAD